MVLWSASKPKKGVAESQPQAIRRSLCGMPPLGVASSGFPMPCRVERWLSFGRNCDMAGATNDTNGDINGTGSDTFDGGAHNGSWKPAPPMNSSSTSSVVLVFLAFVLRSTLRSCGATPIHCPVLLAKGPPAILTGQDGVLTRWSLASGTEGARPDKWASLPKRPGGQVWGVSGAN